MSFELINYDESNDNIEVKRQFDTLPWIEKYRPSTLNEIMN